jgi:hypothetical protein
MEYKEQADKAGDWSTGIEVRVGHGSWKVGEKRRFGDACDTGWGKAAEEGPCSEGDEKLKDKRQKETKHKQEGFFQTRGRGRLWRRELEASFVRASRYDREGAVWGGSGRGGGRGRHCEEGARKVPAQPSTKPGSNVAG